MVYVLWTVCQLDRGKVEKRLNIQRYKEKVGKLA